MLQTPDSTSLPETSKGHLYSARPALRSKITSHSIAPAVFPILDDGNSNSQAAYSKNTKTILGFFFLYSMSITSGSHVSRLWALLFTIRSYHHPSTWWLKLSPNWSPALSPTHQLPVLSIATKIISSNVSHSMFLLWLKLCNPSPHFDQRESESPNNDRQVTTWFASWLLLWLHLLLFSYSLTGLPPHIKHSRHAPTLRPLPWLVPLCGLLFFQISTWLSPLLPVSLYDQWVHLEHSVTPAVTCPQYSPTFLLCCFAHHLSSSNRTCNWCVYHL